MIEKLKYYFKGNLVLEVKITKSISRNYENNTSLARGTQFPYS